jgi:hypothetical protein
MLPSNAIRQQVAGNTAVLRALYIVYMTAQAGSSIGLFYIGDGIIAGVDMVGVRYDGRYVIDPESKELRGSVDFVMPALSHLITGESAGLKPQSMTFPITLPEDFSTKDYVTIDTPSGPLNAKFEKTREL